MRYFFINASKNKNTIGGFFYFMSTVLLVAGVIGILLGTQAASSIEDSIIESDKHLLKQVHASMDAIMRQNDQLHFLLTTDSSVRQFPESYAKWDVDRLLSVSSKFNNLFGANPYLVSVDIYYPSLGLVYIANSGVLKADSYTDPEILSIIDAGVPSSRWILSRRIFDIHTARNMMVSTEILPIDFMHGQPNAIAIINLSTAFLMETLNDLTIRERTTLAVFDGEGNMLASSSGWDQSLSSGIFEQMAEQSYGNFYGDLGGEKKLISYQEEPIRGWKYVGVTPEDAVFGPIRSIRNFSVIVSIVGAVLGIGVSLIFSQRLYKPFVKIVRQLGGRGDSDVSLQYIEASIQNLKTRNESIEKTLIEYLPVMVNRFLSDLLLGYFKDSDEIVDKLDYYGLQFDRLAAYCVFVVLIDVRRIDNERYSQQQINMFTVYIMELLQAHLRDQSQGVVVNIKGSEIAVIVRIGELEDEDNNRKVESIGRHLAAAVAEGVSHIRIIGAGCCSPIMFIEESYAQAVTALAYRFSSKNSRLIFYHQISKISGVSADYPLEAENKLILAIRRGRGEDARQQLSSILACIFLPGENNESLRSYRLMRLLGAIVKASHETGAFPVSENEVYETMLSYVNDETGLYAWFISFIDGLIGVFLDNAEGRDQKLSAEIATYVQENYVSCDLSLSKLSSEFYFSAPYISKIFREETGVNIKQYITKIRMEKAKEMLLQKDQDKKINQIAAAVGYDKVHSFMKQFKEYTGMTPGQYRSLDKT